MKKILFLTIIFFSYLLGVFANEKITVTLDKCVDGDTAFFLINNISTKVRFIGIDTPEINEEENILEPYSKEAKDYTCKRLTNAKEIVLEFDPKSDKTDKYNRALAWVWVDDSLLEGELLEQGYAKIRYIYDKYSNLDILNKKENYAKENKIGLWSDYIPKYYKVTFKDEKIIKEITVKENELIEYFEPSKENYKFIGWYVNNTPFDFNTGVTNDIILEARYQIDINILKIVLIIIILLTIYSIRKVIYNGRRKIKQKTRNRKTHARG